MFLCCAPYASVQLGRQLVPDADVPELDDVAGDRTEPEVAEDVAAQQVRQTPGRGPAGDAPPRRRRTRVVGVEQLVEDLAADDVRDRGQVGLRLAGAVQLERRERGDVGGEREEPLERGRFTHGTAAGCRAISKVGAALSPAWPGIGLCIRRVIWSRRRNISTTASISSSGSSVVGVG